MQKVLLVFLLSVCTLPLHAQKKYMFVFLHTKPDKEVLSKQQTDSLQTQHMANIRELAKQDKLHAAGPFEGGGGIFILNTTSAADAREWVAGDPAVRANRYNIEILPWTPRQGSVCPLDGEIEMVPYTFVRYQSFITKFNVQQAPQWFLKHDEYIKDIIRTGNVISEGVFDNSDGSTLIMKGDVEAEVIYADPAVKNGILQPEIKQLWIAKGSFCEQ